MSFLTAGMMPIASLGSVAVGGMPAVAIAAAAEDGNREIIKAVRAEQNKGENQLPKVVQGVRFQNGIEVIEMPAHHAA
jgi:hypothetical protein